MPLPNEYVSQRIKGEERKTWAESLRVLVDKPSLAEQLLESFDRHLECVDLVFSAGESLRRPLFGVTQVESVLVLSSHMEHPRAIYILPEAQVAMLA